MRWQKIARFAIAVFVIGFAIVVFLAMRPRPSTPSNANDLARADPEGALRERPRRTQDPLISASWASTSSTRGSSPTRDGRSKMGGVTLTLPDRNGRTFVVTADEGEFLAPRDKPAESADGKLNGHVKLTTDNGFEVLASEATYDGKTGILTIPGPVTFTKGRMKGSGVGATYDRNRDVIWLLAEARITVTPDAAGAGAVDGSASKAGLARADNFVKLEGTARLTTDTRTAEADVITAYLDEKGEKIQTDGAARAQPDHEHRRERGAHDRPATSTCCTATDGRTLQSIEADGRLGARVPGRGRRAGAGASPGRRLRPPCRPMARRSRTSPRRRTSRSICRWRATARHGGSRSATAARDGRTRAGDTERGLRGRRRLRRNPARCRQGAGARPARALHPPDRRHQARFRRRRARRLSQATCASSTAS